MRAVIQTAYGGPEVYSLADRPVPEPDGKAVRVRVRATSLHPDIWHVMCGRPYVLRLMGAGLRRPKNPIPGTDLAGIVEAVGPEASRFCVGDAVFGEAVVGHQWKNAGTFAEYAIVQESQLALKPESATFEEAAALPTAGFIALQVTRGEARVRAGQRVLINGAGGGVGSLALQMACAFGAEVTAVDDSRKRELLMTLGASQFIDYQREDFTETKVRYDAIIDVPCNHPFSRIRRVLAPDGIYVMVGHDAFGAANGKWLGAIPYALGLTVRSLWDPQLPGLRGALPAPDRLQVLQQLLESGKLRPRIGRTFPLAEIRQAMSALIAGDSVGRIVLSV